jgi:hypothetical protein
LKWSEKEGFFLSTPTFLLSKIALIGCGNSINGQICLPLVEHITGCYFKPAFKKEAKMIELAPEFINGCTQDNLQQVIQAIRSKTQPEKEIQEIPLKPS